MPRLLSITAGILLLLLMVFPRAAAQTPTSCGELQADVMFEPSNCIPDGGAATLVTRRFGSGLVSVFIVGDVGRVGRADRTVRIANDGILRLKIDTNDFFGSSIPSGNFRVIVKDPTGFYPPVSAPFTVAGIPPEVEPPTVAPEPTNARRPAPTPAATETIDPAEDPIPTDSADPTDPTETIEPTVTEEPTVTPELSTSIIIVDVDKFLESVTLENTGDVTIDLTGWRLVNFTTQAEHPIEGEIGAGEIRQFDNPNPEDEIWDDSADDQAELYDPNGALIDIFPK